MIRIITSPCWQPEKEYVFHVLLREMLGLEYRVEYESVAGQALYLPNGKVLEIEDWFPILDASDNREFPIRLSGSWLVNSSLPQSSNSPIPDLFAASFFLLTRWEEKASISRDVHGRFPAKESVAWKHGFLNRPVVNEWVDWLWEHLVRCGWQGARKKRQFKLSVSCDVDHPRLWWSKAEWVKTLGGAIFKRMDLKEAGYWLRNNVFSKKDPYDVYDEGLDLFEKNNIVAQFNFMGDRPRSSDCWYPLQHPFVQGLIRKIADRGHKIGFHPSYEAFDSQEVFERELASLRKISPIEISSGRQHYLRFDAPQTWQMWEAAGLQEDCTLGYPEAAGFRCGICHDYPVFDTIQRKMLNLREKPLLAMDITLALYRGYTPEKASAILSALRSEVEKHGGDFTILWHNSSWNTAFWEDWKAVFHDFISR